MWQNAVGKLHLKVGAATPFQPIAATQEYNIAEARSLDYSMKSFF